LGNQHKRETEKGYSAQRCGLFHLIEIVMIKLCGHIRPSDIKGVALSGGVDSMALLSFLRNEQRPRWIKAFFFDHGTETSEKAHEFVAGYCALKGIDLEVGRLRKSKPKKDSWEEFWRKERYKWLHSQPFIIATAHHLNDVAETYLWSMAHGHPRFIHYQKPFDEQETQNIVRPLLLTPKSELVSWCERHQVPYIEDHSNEDLRFTRNRIRHNIMPEMLKVNPGFLKIVARKLIEDQCLDQ
jgi:tRNA(Ile)-lysidine synthase